MPTRSIYFSNFAPDFEINLPKSNPLSIRFITIPQTNYFTLNEKIKLYLKRKN